MNKKTLFDDRPRVKRKLNSLPENPEKADPNKAVGPGRFPSWLHRPLPKGGGLGKTGAIVEGQQLHTVCEEAQCPNLLECWSKKTATFLIMGKQCTRNCGFCDIDYQAAPPPLDPKEPEHVATASAHLGLNHVVITMVARDDLPDGGAAHIAKTVEAVRERCPKTTVELLTWDFNGEQSRLEQVLEAKAEIFNHNLETVRRLTPRVRHKATYERTLGLLKMVKEISPTTLVKSGLMVGLGESEEEIYEALEDLKGVGCDIVTIGQYLQPNRKKLLVKAFVTPDQFKKYEVYGHKIGIPHLYCGPFVRSSYNAEAVLKQVSNP
jgi:lipoic acid synthetase